MKVLITDSNEFCTIECLDNAFGLDHSGNLLNIFLPDGVSLVSKNAFASLTQKQFDFFTSGDNLSRILKAIWGIDTTTVVTRGDQL